MISTAASTPERDLASEADRLLDAVEAQQIPARLIGGMAIRILAGPRLHPAFKREIADLDFIVAAGAGNRLGELIAASGYRADEQFNALNGARRLLFFDPANERQVDVFVGSFEMCHSLPLADRLELRPRTVPAAELLMTKLQIVELNRKDRADALALLLAHDVAEDDWDAGGADCVNTRYIAELTSRDWGLQRTFELNLGRLREGLAEVALDEDERETVIARIDRIAEAMESAPKSRKWKMRARVGKRVQWYDEPEEVDRA